MRALLLALVFASPVHAAEVDWKVLRQTEVQATSFLQSNWNKYSENYHPNYVADDNPKTAWVEGVSGNGEGESILLPTHAIKDARAVRLRIRNGYQKSEALLQANAAPKQVRIAILAAGQEVAHTTATLARTMGWQEVVVALPAGKGLSAVRLQVDSVHPGSKYKDTCISDIVVEVDTDLPYRPAIEEARLQKLRAWTQERKETAAWFARLPPTYPFAATAFDTTRIESGDDDADAAMLTALEQEAAAAAKAGSWWKRTAKGATAKAPDQLEWLDELMPLFNPAQLAWFETDQQFARKLQEETDWSSTARHLTNARVTFHPGSPPVPATIWFEQNFESEERGFYRDTSQHFVKCDATGRPVEIFTRYEGVDELGLRTTLRRHQLTWTDDGQVSRIQSVAREEVEQPDYLPKDESPVRFTRRSYAPKQ